MKPKLLLLLIAVLLAVSNTLVVAQDWIKLNRNAYCSFAPNNFPDGDYPLEEPSQEAVALLEELLQTLGMTVKSSNIILKVAAVENAIAAQGEDTDKRFILYSHRFINSLKLSVQKEWAVKSILAHEIGHHFFGHNLNETDARKRKANELAADEFSASILRILCATEEEAMAAISELPSGANHPYYPPLSVRKETIANSWNLKDESLKIQGNDKCWTEIGLNFGDKYNQSNLAKDVIARVRETEMTIFFNADGVPESSGYESFIVTDKISELEPRSIMWITDRKNAGRSRQVKWNFAADGYTKSQVLKASELGIAVFEEKKVPKAVEIGGYALSVGAILFGGGSYLYGTSLKNQAFDDHSNPYASVRDPGADIYQSPNLPRADIYSNANSKYHRAQGFRNAGISLAIGGAVLLVKKIIRDKKSRVGHMFKGGEDRKVDPRVFFDRNP